MPAISTRRVCSAMTNTNVEACQIRQPRLNCPETISLCKTLGCCIEEGRLTKFVQAHVRPAVDYLAIVL
jgi:hypothetical protein